MAVHGGSFVFGIDTLDAIACAAADMAQNACGTPPGGQIGTSVNTYLYAINCSFKATVSCLGGTPYNSGADSDLNLLMAMACNSRALATQVGGTPVGTGYVYEAFSLWWVIACNLRQVAIHTGTPDPTGGGYDGIPNLMQAVYCYLQDIVGNGFAPAELFSFKAGDRPAGSIFSRGGSAYLLANSAPPTTSPSWYTVDSPVGILAAIGDSITIGSLATESYFPKAQRIAASTKRLNNANLGVGGAFLSNSGSAATDMTSITSALFDPVFTSSKGVAIVFGGTNDIFIGAVSGATAFARLKTVCNQIRASHTHVKIIAVTPLPRQNNGAFETERQSLRSLINGGDSSYDFVADWGGNATMALNAASSTNTTYYNSDQIHPKDAGQVIGGSIVGPVLQTALAAAGL